MEEREDLSICGDVPNILSSFVDTFVDFSVSGLFLPPPLLSNHPSSSDSQSSPQNQNQDQKQSSLGLLYHPPPDRLIAVGDVHGDLSKLKQALSLAGLLDPSSGRWSGGSATLVQVGDVLDRGGQELQVIYFLEKLRREASRSGGAVLTMNGNHEVMNADGDFRYVTRAGLDEFRVWSHWFRAGNSMKALCRSLPRTPDPFRGIPASFPNVRSEFAEGLRARIAALRPHGPVAARFLSQNATVLVVGQSVFVHGGLLPEHVSYGLERINEEAREWLAGAGAGRAVSLSPGHLRGRNSVVWLRRFSHGAARKCDCSTLEHVLETIPGAKRMIMGHTIQENGINGACGNRAIRIDVGMSRGCVDGLPEVLEISRDSELRVLTSNPSFLTKEHKSSVQVQAERKDGVHVLLPPPPPPPPSEHGPRPVDVKA